MESFFLTLAAEWKTLNQFLARKKFLEDAHPPPNSCFCITFNLMTKTLLAKTKCGNEWKVDQ